MSVFKENFTSKILQKEALKIINKSKKNLKILEIGCGNGNISKFLIDNQKNIKHEYFLSDISKEAINSAKKNIVYKKSTFKVGSLFSPWKGNCFDFIISDVSSISDEVAKYSDWYKGIKCISGKNGLKNIKKIINQTSLLLNRNGSLLFPIISLCDVCTLKQMSAKNFQKIKYSKKYFWPLPKFFSKRIQQFKQLKEMNMIEYDEKFGIYLAYTHTAICQKTY